jgi:hypothetical protein
MAITPNEAAMNKGRLVIYRPPGQDAAQGEEGRIVGVSKTRASQRFVFVDFGHGSHPACRPEDLTFSLTTTSSKESTT